MFKPFSTALSIAAVLATSATIALAQGSLTPPGAPAATMKTLDQLEARTPISSLPYTISSSGSYYLTANLNGISNSDGITVTADNVTIDLNGFTIAGNPSYTAVVVSGTRKNVSVINGTIYNWARGGIGAATSTGCLFERLRISNCSAAGLYAGFHSTIKDCVATANVSGIIASNGCNIANCTVSGNSSTGIQSAGGALIVNCTANSNAFYGILAGFGSTVTGCTVVGNSNGGIANIFNGTVANCTVADNLGTGIAAAYFSTIRNCNVTGNTNHGISLGNNNVAIDNSCMDNGTPGNTNTAGILVGNNNRVENNSLMGNATRGIKLNASFNLIIRNTASANTGLNFDTNGFPVNTVGPILVSGIATNIYPYANLSH